MLLKVSYLTLILVVYYIHRNPLKVFNMLKRVKGYAATERCDTRLWASHKAGRFPQYSSNNNST